jgi:hypothetical protein
VTEFSRTLKFWAQKFEDWERQRSVRVLGVMGMSVAREQLSGDLDVPERQSGDLRVIGQLAGFDVEIKAVRVPGVETRVMIGLADTPLERLYAAVGDPAGLDPAGGSSCGWRTRSGASSMSATPRSRPWPGCTRRPRPPRAGSAWRSTKSSVSLHSATAKPRSRRP